MSGGGRAEHWDAAYQRVGEAGGSWFQREPTCSLELIDAAGITAGMSLIDAGGGASLLVDRLLDGGFSEVAVLDVSAEALDLAKRRLGERSAGVRWIVQDVLTWRPDRTFDVWHDRAVFHFLVSGDDRRRYLDVLAAATHATSRAIIGTFAADGPEQCSGLPVARYTPDGLTAALGSVWRPVADLREEHRTPGGGVQPFTWVAYVRG